MRRFLFVGLVAMPGAALEMKSARRLDDVAGEISDIRSEAEAAREIVLTYCS